MTEDRTKHDDTGAAAGAALREREKELDFVYEAAALLSQARLLPEETYSRLAASFARAMEQPDLAVVQIRIGDQSSVHAPAGNSAVGDHYTAAYGEGDRVTISVGYPRLGKVFLKTSISAREQALCDSFVRLLGISMERIEAESRERNARKELERKNAALSELLSRIEIERQNLRIQLQEHIETDAYPLLSRIASIDQDQEGAVLASLIRGVLEKALSATPARASDPRRLLSLREFEVCELVLAGLSSKEIAQRLSIARSTVERHRHNARRKLGMPDRKGSIRSAFSS